MLFGYKNTMNCCKKLNFCVINLCNFTKLFGICVMILKEAGKNRGSEKGFRGPEKFSRGPERMLGGPEIYRVPGPQILYFNHCFKVSGINK